MIQNKYLFLCILLLSEDSGCDLKAKKIRPILFSTCFFPAIWKLFQAKSAMT